MMKTKRDGRFSTGSRSFILPLQEFRIQRYPIPWIDLQRGNKNHHYLLRSEPTNTLRQLRYLPPSSRITLAYTTVPQSRNLSLRSCQEVLHARFETKHLRPTRIKSSSAAKKWIQWSIICFRNGFCPWVPWVHEEQNSSSDHSLTSHLGPCTASEYSNKAYATSCAPTCALGMRNCFCA